MRWLWHMAPFLFRCPNVGLQVQGWRAEGASQGGEAYLAVSCTACTRIHLVNPATGKVLGADDEWVVSVGGLVTGPCRHPQHRRRCKRTTAASACLGGIVFIELCAEVVPIRA